MGRETDAVEFLAALAAEPYRYDFYQTLRRLECLYQDKPRVGCAQRPADEPVRFGQVPELTFAPAPLASFEVGEGELPRLQVRLFGLFGPNGPLPLHITEYAHERLLNANDATVARFFDLFHHRFLEFFYRAWAQAQPHVSRDRPDADPFAGYVGSFFGTAPPVLRKRDAVSHEAKLFHAGVLMRQVRNADGLNAILQQFFRVPLKIEQYVGHWMRLGAGERTSLGGDGATLGSGAVLGSRVWDRQHKFRIRLGPLTLKQYENFLPKRPSTESGTGGVAMAVRSPRDGGLRQLVDWVRFYLCFELEWDVQLSLDSAEVPPLRLGASERLGWTTWLGQRPVGTDADDLCLDAETLVGRVGVAT